MVVLSQLCLGGSGLMVVIIQMLLLSGLVRRSSFQLANRRVHKTCVHV